MHVRRHLALLAVTVLALAGCANAGGDEPVAEEAGAEQAAEEPVEVVVTTSILGDVAQEVLAGTDAQVDVLLPPGADPHGYEPSAADGVTLREADMVIAVGVGLEEALLDTIEAAEEDGVEVLRVGELVDPIPYAAGQSHDHGEGEEPVDEDQHGHGGEDEHGHDDGEEHAGEDKDEHAEEDEHGHGEEEKSADDGHAESEEHAEDEERHDHEGELDPHVWLDPVRAGQIAQEIAAAYAELVPDAADTVTAAADDYAQRMEELDAELAEMIATLPPERRQLITNHDAVGYLADRYDLEVVATVLPGTSADVDVTAEAFSDLVTLLRETGIPAVFGETTAPDRLAQALAGEVEGVQVVQLYTDSLGEPGSGADSLEGMLRTDVERIVDALG